MVGTVVQPSQQPGSDDSLVSTYLLRRFEPILQRKPFKRAGRKRPVPKVRLLLYFEGHTSCPHPPTHYTERAIWSRPLACLITYTI